MSRSLSNLIVRTLTINSDDESVMTYKNKCYYLGWERSYDVGLVESFA